MTTKEVLEGFKYICWCWAGEYEKWSPYGFNTDEGFASIISMCHPIEWIITSNHINFITKDISVV